MEINKSRSGLIYTVQYYSLKYGELRYYHRSYCTVRTNVPYTMCELNFSAKVVLKNTIKLVSQAVRHKVQQSVCGPTSQKTAGHRELGALPCPPKDSPLLSGDNGGRMASSTPYHSTRTWTSIQRTHPSMTVSSEVPQP